MKHLLNFEEFIKLNDEIEFNKIRERFKKLAGLSKESDNEEVSDYFILVTFDKNCMLLEHETYKFFQNTNNRYSYHSEVTNPPVEAHYHVYGQKDKKELYAVNLNGKAHHKRNRGTIIPKKEADELRSLGVTIPKNNILETIEFNKLDKKELLLEGIYSPFYYIYIKIASEE